ncbi:hypothetical protein K2P56_01795 [Patescibacteria group bacterium]|nr:hypothetical protein [Patescibacteria group bacterium]
MNPKPAEAPELPAEDTSMSFFITSANPGKGGDLGGIKGADAYCAQLAEAVGVTGKTWRAYLSSYFTDENPAVNAKDRIGNGPWYNAKGKLIAENVFRLHSDQNNLNKNTALTEKGEVVSGRGDEVNVHDILTGSTMEGMLAVDSSGKDTTCDNWTSSTDGSAVVGHHDRVGIDDSAPMKSWNASHASRGCSLENLKSTGGGGLFYCFAQ